MARKCTYHGSAETCLLKNNKYPVTKNGTLSCKRVRAATSYGSKYGILGELKDNGLCGYIKKCNIDSSVC